MALRSITIRIGYTWDDKLAKDERWRALREFCESAGRQGLSQANTLLARAVTAEDDGEGEPSSLEEAWKAGRLPGLRVERLRASAGRFAWENIRSRIDGADILVFDYTPVAKGGRDVAATSGNVWLELGYAYGRKEPENVFVTHAESDGHHDIPSDLRGLIVGHLPDSGGVGDRSLRAAIAGAVKRIAIERAEASMQSGSHARTIETLSSEVPESPTRKQAAKGKAVSKPKTKNPRSKG